MMRSIVVVVVLISLFCTVSQCQRDTYPDTFAATDALGRTLPSQALTGPPRADTKLGIFYFLANSGDHPGPYDNNLILAAANGNISAAKFGPPGASHHWSRPLMGYYVNDDEWIIRKHAQMLVDAGVDYITFDVTNAVTYDDVWTKIFNVYADIRRNGGRTPYITFILWTAPPPVFQHLYELIYATNFHSDLWFMWQGKPMIFANSTGMNASYINDFTWRESWAWHTGSWFGNGFHRWMWIDNYPQGYGWDKDPSIKEQMPATVGGWSTANIGRSFNGTTESQPPYDFFNNRHIYGHYAQQQWEHALQVSCQPNTFTCKALDPSYVQSQTIFVTGWNEWTASRFIWHQGQPPQPMLGRLCEDGDSFFVDEYDQEFSRDIEPMSTALDGSINTHSDNYYYQFIAMSRYYKGVRILPKTSEKKTININNDFTQWNDVLPVYYDDNNDIFNRSYKGFGNSGLYYTDNSTRDDICTSKIARDDNNYYFFLNMCKPFINNNNNISFSYLFINSQAYLSTLEHGWNGYDLLYNVSSNILYMFNGNNHTHFSWKIYINNLIDYTSSINYHVAIPRTAMIDHGRIYFKWWNGAHEILNNPLFEIEKFILYGDAAPNSRFAYQYDDSSSTSTTTTNEPQTITRIVTDA